jgi:septation ring formation regulator EzrA
MATTTTKVLTPKQVEELLDELVHLAMKYHKAKQEEEGYGKMKKKIGRPPSYYGEDRKSYDVAYELYSNARKEVKRIEKRITKIKETIIIETYGSN